MNPVYTNDRYTNAAHAEIIGDAGPSAPWLAMVHGIHHAGKGYHRPAHLIHEVAIKLEPSF